jgi:hypothetical protein
MHSGTRRPLARSALAMQRKGQRRPSRRHRRDRSRTQALHPHEPRGADLLAVPLVDAARGPTCPMTRPPVRTQRVGNPQYGHFPGGPDRRCVPRRNRQLAGRDARPSAAAQRWTGGRWRTRLRGGSLALSPHRLPAAAAIRPTTAKVPGPAATHSSISLGRAPPARGSLTGPPHGAKRRSDVRAVRSFQPRESQRMTVGLPVQCGRRGKRVGLFRQRYLRERTTPSRPATKA